MKTQLWAIGIVIMNTVIAAIGGLFLKYGSNTLTRKRDMWKLWKHRNILYGLGLYGFGSILAIYAYKGGNLNVLFPISALTYIWSMILAVKYLNERMNLWKWVAITLIVIGTLLVVQ